MEIYRTQYTPLVGLILLTFLGCTKEIQCKCIQTTTDFQYNEVTVLEYTIDNCDEPFTQTTVYRWGNVVTDCR